MDDCVWYPTLETTALMTVIVLTEASTTNSTFTLHFTVLSILLALRY